MFWLPAIGAALVYWWFSLRDGHGGLRSLIKGLAVAPLAVMAFVEGAPLVALALALCSLGDVILSRPGQNAFLGGLIAFALGHVVWIAVFVMNFAVSPALLFDGTRIIAFGGLVWHTAFFTRKLIPRAGALKLPVAVYIALIFSMGVTALATPSALILLGAAMFVASDSLLGMQTFVLQRGSQNERVANAFIWPLYWGAIALLTTAALA